MRRSARRAPAPGQNIDIIAQLQNRLARGRDAEKRLVDCILADLQFAASAPIARIAERAGVSEPTITRLARALGFPGTKEMRFHLAQALAVGGAYLRNNSALVPETGEEGPAIARVCGAAHAALDLISVALSSVDLDALVRPVIGADQILIYGTGGMSSMAACELQNRLFRLGLHATAHTDPQMQRMSASVLTERSVAIGFSVSGQARSVSDALSIARQYGAHSMAVTIAGSPLTLVADALLPVTLKEEHDLYKPSSARYALLAAVDILALSAARNMGPPVLEKLRRVRQSLSAQYMHDPQLPIGD